jgi:hypothetical protein
MGRSLTRRRHRARCVTVAEVMLLLLSLKNQLNQIYEDDESLGAFGPVIQGGPTFAMSARPATALPTWQRAESLTHKVTLHRRMHGPSAAHLPSGLRCWNWTFRNSASPVTDASPPSSPNGSQSCCEHYPGESLVVAANYHRLTLDPAAQVYNPCLQCV